MRVAGPRRVPLSTTGGTGSPRERDVAAATTQVKILVPGHQPMVALLGQQDAFLKLIEAAGSRPTSWSAATRSRSPAHEHRPNSHISSRNSSVLEKGHQLRLLRGPDDRVDQGRRRVGGGRRRDRQDAPERGPRRHAPHRAGTSVAPKTVGQKRFVDAMRRATVTFAIGPAGTGKTYLAVATAVRAPGSPGLAADPHRPAVEAGAARVPAGDALREIDPCMRPLYDALFEMTGAESLAMERGTVEVAPRLHARQDWTTRSSSSTRRRTRRAEQMKMFLTQDRFGSKAVVNGDDTQVDLATGRARVSS